MLLLLECALFGSSVLAQLLDLLFVASILGHVAYIRLDVIATLECLPSLRILKVTREFVKPLRLIFLRFFCCSHRTCRSLAYSLGTLLFLMSCLFLDMDEGLLECINGRFGID